MTQSNQTIMYVKSLATQTAGIAPMEGKERSLLLLVPLYHTQLQKTNLKMTSLFGTWLRLIKNNPVAFNAVTGCSLCASSDVLAQYLEKQDETLGFRIRRVLSAGAVGAFFGKSLRCSGCWLIERVGRIQF
jgi:hypothetical protein